MAARQLPPGRRPRSATSASTCPRALLPRAADARLARARRATRASTRWRSSWSATATAGSTASSSRVFINSYQRVAPLTIGELWAWPSMLKLALIENLRRLADETLEARQRAPRRRRLRRADRRARAATARRRCRRRSTPTFVVQLLHRAARVRRPRSPSIRDRGRGAPRRRRTRPRKRRSAASTSARRPTRSRSPTRSRACASARRSTGASTSSR